MPRQGESISNAPSPDITQRKRMEEALRESETKFKTIVENIRDVVFQLSPLSIIQYVSPKVQEVYGYKPEDLIGKYLKKTTPISEVPKALGALKSVLSGKVINNLEINQLDSKGRIIPMEINAVPVRREGKIIAVQGIMRDITERKRAEEALRRAHDELEIRVEERTEELVKTNEVLQSEIGERKRMEEALRDSERKYRALFENLNDAVFLADAETGYIIDTNKQGEVLLGRTREEVIGMHQRELHPPGAAKEYCQRFATHVQKGHAADFDGEVIRKDGSIVPVNISATPVTIGGKQLILGLFRDITERKRAEEATRIEKERAEAYLNIAGVMLAVVNADENITLINKKGCEILGYKESELIGRNWVDLLVPRGIRNEVRGVFRQLMAGDIKPVEYYENPLLTKNGEERLIAFHNTIIRAPGGQIAGVLFSGEDITERKQAEEALKSSEEQLKILFEFAPDAYYLNDLKGNFVNGNKAAEEVTGYKREELIGKSFLKLKLLPPRQIPKAAALLAKNMLGQATGPDELTFTRKDGSQVPLEIRTFPVKIEGKTLVLGIARDITQRKQAEEELRESEKRYRRLFEMSPIGITTLDMKGVITSCNPAVYREGGYSEDEIVGKHFSKITPIRFRDIPKHITTFSSVIRGKIPKPFEVAYNRKDGTIGWTEIHLTLLKADSKKLGILVLQRDITQRKQAEEALQLANEELRETEEQLIRSEKLAAIGQLAGGVGHELRNPLGAIKNAIYYIRGKVANSELAQKEPRVTEFLDIMDDEINSSNKIINDLLGFSRVGKPSVSPAKIERVIEDALARTPIPENIEVAKKFDEDLPEVNIATGQIRQVFINIITNAVQAMPEGGKLNIGAREKDEYLEVEVADTGCGIPQEVTGKIFDPLFTTRAKGIGLGLAVCRTIIESHEGNITVNSKVGKGTTFTIKLPLKRE